MINTSRTQKALLGRGIDSGTVEKLCAEGYTLQKLKSTRNLSELGLTKEEIGRIQKGNRPPIPPKTTDLILYRSSFTCCICRKKRDPIVIHHIEEWSKTKDHSEKNLAILCLNCHSKAHSKSNISTNLTGKMVQSAKEEWEKTVKRYEADALYTKSSWGTIDGMWDYFNHMRIVDVIQNLRIDLNYIDEYKNLLAAGVIERTGGYIRPALSSNSPRFIYDGSIPNFNRTLTKYYANLVKRIVEETEWLDISSTFRRSTANLLKENMIISVTGAHRFKKINNIDSGPGQSRVGYKQGNGLKVVFSIDAWEATSTSSHVVHLSGNWRCSSILIVRSIENSKSRAIVNCTCLAIGTGFTDYTAPVPSIAFREEDYEE